MQPGDTWAEPCRERAGGEPSGGTQRIRGSCELRGGGPVSMKVWLFILEADCGMPVVQDLEFGE